MNKFYYSENQETQITQRTKREDNKNLKLFLSFVLLTMLYFMSFSVLHAQSGGWDSYGTVGTTGFSDHGSGVIQLHSTASNGCAGAAVHETSDQYDPTSGAVFNKCYQVFFGCPGNDEIGSDAQGDGMAFSFSKCAYNINNGLACGGGLGYMGSCGQMITIEFDTYSSQGNSGFDANYGGGTTGNQDEIALHRDGNASDAGRITSVNAGNLEDGLEHTVCINYNPATHILSVSIDGVPRFSYDLTGSPYDLPTYFGSGGLNQTWSSGKFGATNPSTVSDGANIAATIGGPLCPANVVITAPASGASIGGCSVGPVTIAAASTPPAGNTVGHVEFFVDGVSIGEDHTAPYTMDWTNPVDGTHALTAVAHYTPSGTTSTSGVVNVTVGGGIKRTSSAPVIDGTIEALWNNYAPYSLDQVPVGVISGPADASAVFRTMWDDTHLYIMVEVTDDVLRDEGGNQWDDDGVEIFIDMGNTKNATYGAGDYQFAFVYNRSVITEYKHNAIAGVTFAQGSRPDGYLMEISIPWSTLGGVPNHGDLIGFDVHVNDDDGEGGDFLRDSKIAWHDATDDAHHSPAAFGTITMLDCDPCPTGVLSGNNTICDDGIATGPLSVSFTGTGPWSFVYSIDGVSQPEISGIPSSPYIFPSSPGAHTYLLVAVTNPYTSGCTGNASGTALINAVSIPRGHDGTFINPGTTLLSVENTGAVYEWYDAPSGGNLVHTGTSYTTPVLTDTTHYYVQEASVISCRAELRAIPLNLSDPGSFFIPSLITPNNDGKNDQFEILSLPAGSALSVFNRWGDCVYKSSNYDNQWAASNTSDGVYYYDLILPDGKYYKGWLNVVR